MITRPSSRLNRSRSLAASLVLTGGFTAVTACNSADDAAAPSAINTIEAEQKLACRVGGEHDGHGHPYDGDDDEGSLPVACNGYGNKSPGASAAPIVHTIPNCTGVDDTSVVQQALAAADEVRLPAGTCVVRGLFVQKKPIKLSGQGKGRSILKYRPRAGDSSLFFSNGGRTIITDLTIDGSRGAGAQVGGIQVRPKTCLGPVMITRVEIRDVGGRAVIVSGSGAGTINGIPDDGDGVGANRVSIFQNEVSNAGGGILVVTSTFPNLTRVRLHDNTIQSDDDGIQIRGVHDAQVFHNQVTTTLQAGVRLESGGSLVSITGNDVRGCGTGGIALGGGALNTGSGIIISGNRVTACADGVSVAHMTKGRFTDVTVKANELTGNRGAGVMVECGASITVTDNQLSGNGSAGLQVLVAPPLADCGERCSSVDALVVSRNVFRAGGALSSAGVYLANSAARGVQIANNDLRYDVPAPPYRPVDVTAPPAAGELTFTSNIGWPTLLAAP